MFNAISLKCRIKASKTAKEIDMLIDESRNYKLASKHTIRQWKQLADKCKADLKHDRENGSKKRQVRKKHNKPKGKYNEGNSPKSS